MGIENNKDTISTKTTIPQEIDNQIDQHKDSLEDLFNQLFANHDTKVAKAVSRQEREENGFISTTLVYGEISFKPFTSLLHQLHQKHGNFFPENGGVFVDIGCGSGKAVFAAALSHDFSMCLGIEVLHGLHVMSNQVMDVWRNDIVKNLRPSTQNTRFSFVYNDATLVDWSNADIVFCNSTCFNDTLMEKISDCALKLRKGAYVLTATRTLPDDTNSFRLVEECTMEESWGTATIYVHIKQRS